MEVESSTGSTPPAHDYPTAVPREACAGLDHSKFCEIGMETHRGPTSKNLFIVESLARILNKEMVKQAQGVGSDSTAAGGTAGSTALPPGKERVRHLAARYLWIQDSKRNGDLTIFKEKTADNVADIGTKSLAADRILMLLKKSSVRSLRALGWSIPRTALTAAIFANEAREAKAETQCNCTCDYYITTSGYTKILISLLVVIIGMLAALCVMRPRTSTPGGGGGEDDQRSADVPNMTMPNNTIEANEESNFKKMPPSTCDVLVQAPVTYLRKRSTPRFSPMREGEWGAIKVAEREALRTSPTRPDRNDGSLGT